MSDEIMNNDVKFINVICAFMKKAHGTLKRTCGL